MTSTPAPRGPLLMRTPMELRWRDLDAFNHVNNANFMTYLEEARIRFFESADEDWISETVIPLLASVHMDYRLPIPYPAAIHVELYADRVGNSSVTLGHRIVDDTGRLYAEGHCVLVWIDRASGRPVPLPHAIRRATQGG